MGEDMVWSWVYVQGVRVRVESVDWPTFVGSIPATRTPMMDDGRFLGYAETPGGEIVWRTSDVCPGCLDVGDESCPIHQGLRWP